MLFRLRVHKLRVTLQRSFVEAEPPPAYPLLIVVLRRRDGAWSTRRGVSGASFNANFCGKTWRKDDGFGFGGMVKGKWIILKLI
nr:hypothetical protein Itr_chr05CG20040 [Ipomoea trifida]